MRMKSHVTAVAAIHIGMAIFGFLIALIVLAGTFLPGLIATGAGEDPEVMLILTSIGCTVASFIVILSLPELIGGIGLLSFRPWARVLVLVLAALNLFNIPIGTGVGVYTFWALLHEESAELFVE